MRINLPNQITIGRLVLTIVFLVLLAQLDYAPRGRDVWIAQICFWLYLIAAGTDVIDGYLARRQKQVTSFGRILDPFVDKILICGAFCMLAGASFYDPENERYVTGIRPWMVVVIVGRELLVSGLRGFSEGQGTALAASFYGKAKMLVQSIAIGVVLAGPAGIGEAVNAQLHHWLQTAFVWGAVIITALSVISYIHLARSFLSQTTAPADEPQPPSAPGD